MEKNDFSEMIKEVENGIKISSKAFQIGDAAVLGMLYEASTWPSPGLVSPISNGAHNDMDFFLFLRSTSSIAYVMYICAQIGIEYDNELLQRLRLIGKLGEHKMLAETSGINTQRGLLFLAGVLCGAAGSCIRHNTDIKRESISFECKNICGNIVEDELARLNDYRACGQQKPKLTNGEKLYLKYGITGIRGEAQNGLPSVINTGLPLYEAALKEGLPIKDALSHTLVGLMSVVEDTTVVNRCGIEGLEFMRTSAVSAMKLGGMYTPEGIDFINRMDRQFIERKISPGGAADLLAVTVMIKKIEEDFGREIKNG